uniref:Tetraspanin n=1 Tax=Plectus sambesii TaxID=2011161 RepID=A0A914WWJ2_9BILA
MVHGGMTLVKYLLFLFNFIFWLSGIGLVVAGTVIQIKYSQYINFLGDDFLSAPIVLIACGCVITLLGFFGCCGAIRENYCMTMTFGVLLGVILIVEMAVGIASYVLKDDVEQIMKTQMIAGMARYNASEAVGVTLAWNSMQQEFKCCGVDNYTDWRNSTVLGDTNDVPDSCCIQQTADCGVNVRARDWTKANLTIYATGCVGELKDWVVLNVALFGGVACGVACLQVVVLCLACILGSNLRADYYDYY